MIDATTKMSLNETLSIADIYRLGCQESMYMEEYIEGHTDYYYLLLDECERIKGITK